MASLSTYQQKRDFSKTAEPVGVVEKSVTQPRFLIQKHDATRLHYDVRLEIDGVLKSWACPKGPSLDPKDKRLAVEVEDHPMAYGSFEGTIPAGEYGGGTVLLWDHGTFDVEGDALAGWKAGKLHVTLHGEKLKGSFRLVRLPRKGNEKQVSWLLIKSNDEFAVVGGDVAALPEASVKTGRSLQEIADASDSVWHSDRVAARAADGPRRARVDVDDNGQRGGVAPHPGAKPQSPLPPKIGGDPMFLAQEVVCRRAAPASGPTISGRVDDNDPCAQETLGHPRSSGAGGSLARQPMRRRRPKANPTVEGVTISHPERRVFGDDVAITKHDVARYFAAVAPLILPHVEGRPLSVVRCPSGVGGPTFFQKHVGKGMPTAIKALEIEGDDDDWLMVEDAAGLVGLVQMGGIEVHAWGCRPYAPEQPDRIVMDLDPGDDVTWARVADAAKDVRARLEDRGLTTFLKSTGGKGLHVCAPLDGTASWDDVKAFCKGIADEMERDAPDRYTANMRKALRRGRVFVDYLRNGRGATAIAPWCVRARHGAPVSVPLAWSEIDAVPAWTMLNLHQRMAKPDPWESWFDVRQKLPAPRPARSRGIARP